MATVNKFVPAPSNGSVTVNVNYPNAPNKFQFVSTSNKISNASLLNAISKPTDGNYKISRLLGEFKGEIAGDYIPQFMAPIEIEIKYSIVAWELAKDPILGYPKIAYLAHENGDWAEKWVEFRDHVNADIDVTPPVGNGDGVLTITVDNLPDPLIGDC